MGDKPVPADEKLYEKVKKKVYKKYPKHSAYRSGLLVQEYKKEFAGVHGNRKKPYKGKRPGLKDKGIRRWFAEDWRNQDGKFGYQNKNDVYRPRNRIAKDTPTTFSELTESQIKRARREKYRKGRVKRFLVGNKNEDKKVKKTDKKQNKNEKKKVKKGGAKGKVLPVRKKNYIYFEDYPDFRPNLSPREMFKLGSFGGTYWRPIKSQVTGKKHRNAHKKYPKSWWEGIPDKGPDNVMTLPFNKYDVKKNKYGVKVGTTLEFWEGKGWMRKSHPYGWVQWYCDFYMGKRCDDDERQISRWKKLAGKNGRFSRFLVTQILRKSKKADPVDDCNNYEISPKIRQVLQHWGYHLTPQAIRFEIKRRGKNT